MSTSASVRTDLRAATRDAVRMQVANRAIVLLDAQGFDETTVEELAASVGISPRSFFRYFPTKEDVVIGNLMPMGVLIEEELLARPTGEQPWASLRASLSPMVKSTEYAPADVLRQARVALSTANLRARAIERHASWTILLAPIVAARLHEGVGDATLTANSLTQCALACLYVATVAWVDAEGAEPFADLLDTAFQSVHPFEGINNPPRLFQ